MPATQTAKNPQGWTIVFDEESHTYTSKRFVKTDPATGDFVKDSPVQTDECRQCISSFSYTSGTQFIHKFFPEFDPDGKIAAKKARDRGISIEQLRFEWKQKAADACAMGTRVHETCEDVLKDRKDLIGNYEFRNKPQSDHERYLMASGYKAACEVKSKFEILGVEQIVFDIDTLIAGTIDLLARDPSDGTVWILDWKTNEKIDFKNNFREGRKALDPIDHLDNCSGVHYGLQLSTYEYLMKKAGYFGRQQKFRRGIFHLTEQGPKFYELPDYSTEVRDMVIKHLVTPPF